MRINQMSSMNINRNLNQTNALQASNAAKLAAAKQILGAGDDPAGLAISNKMKAQLGGINMAARNSQDAISLMNTAEGALQEVHSMLDRMNELAVQSANGILSAEDRGILNAEFTQLKQEINDISSQSQFNNMSLLDGSLSSLGTMRSAETTGISVSTMTEIAEPVMQTSMSTDTSAITDGAQAQFGVDLGSYEITGSMAGETFSLQVGDATLSFELQGGNYDAQSLAQGIADSLAGQSITIEGNDYTVAASGNTLEFAYDNGGMAENNIAIATESLENLDVAASYQPADGLLLQGAATGAIQSAPVDVSEGEAYNAAPIQMNTARFSGSLKVGDMFNMGGKRFELVVPGTAPSSQDVSPMSILYASSNDQILQQMRDVMAAEMENMDVSVSGNEIKIAQKTPGQGDVSMSMTPANTQSSMVNFNPGRLQAGDQIQLNITDAQGAQRSVSYTHEQGNGMNDIARALGGTRIGNSLSFDNQSVSVEFTPTERSGSGLKIQSGPTEGDFKGVDIQAMNTANLGLDDISIDTQENASSAMTAVQNAVNQVSDQRGSLGAMQNRMQHTINNLNVAAENQAAAISRIEDLDMAQGMMRNMQLRIQEQAQTSMLAHSNANAQNVLSLLR